MRTVLNFISPKRTFSSYWTVADLAHRDGKQIRDRIYIGSLEQNIPQRMLEEYESKTMLKDKVAFRVKLKGQRLVAESHLARSIKGFNMKDFLQEVEDIYFNWTAAFLNGDMVKIREYTTPQYFSTIKKFVRTERERKHKLIWNLEQVSKKKVLDLFPIVYKEGIMDLQIVQASVSFVTIQKLNFWVGDRNPEPKIFETGFPIKDILVFERQLNNPMGKWKIVGKMDRAMNE